MQTKRCSCGERCLHPNGPLLPRSEFFRDRAYADGFKPRCKLCYLGRRHAGASYRTDTPTLRHLAEERARIEAMSPKEYEDERRVRWLPTLADLAILLNPTLRQRERVAHVIVFFKRDCAGDSPSWEQLADILGISRQTVMLYGKQLVERGEATYEWQNTFRMKGVRVVHPYLQISDRQGSAFPQTAVMQD